MSDERPWTPRPAPPASHRGRPAPDRELLERIRQVEMMLRVPACDCCFQLVQQMREAADLLQEARRGAA